MLMLAGVFVCPDASAYHPETHARDIFAITAYSRPRDGAGSQTASGQNDSFAYEIASGATLASESAAIRGMTAAEQAAVKPTGPYTSFKIDPQTGLVRNYETSVLQTNPRNPNPFKFDKNFDGMGEAHFNKATKLYVPTPHVHDPLVPGGIRTLLPDELPRGY